MNEHDFLDELSQETNIKPQEGSIFHKNDALALCRFAKQKGIRILGFEGFATKPDGIMPLMECIADFSHSEASLDTIEFILNSDDFQKADLIEFVFAS